MFGEFDELMAVVGARVRSDLRGAVEQAGLGGRSDQGQGAAQNMGWYGVIVKVEADIDGLVSPDGLRQVTRERMGLFKL